MSVLDRGLGHIGVDRGADADQHREVMHVKGHSPERTFSEVKLRSCWRTDGVTPPVARIIGMAALRADVLVRDQMVAAPRTPPPPAARMDAIAARRARADRLEGAVDLGGALAPK